MLFWPVCVRQHLSGSASNANYVISTAGSILYRVWMQGQSTPICTFALTCRFYPNSMCDLPFVPGSPMQTEEVDKVLARLQCSHGLAMCLTWKGVMRNCGIRHVVRILLRRGTFFWRRGQPGHHWKNAENCGKIRHFCACFLPSRSLRCFNPAVFTPQEGSILNPVQCSRDMTKVSLPVSQWSKFCRFQWTLKT